MPGGNITEYLKTHSNTNQLVLVCYFPPCAEVSTDYPPTDQLSGIADGLDYLHSRGIVHGNLKGASLPEKILL